MKHNVRDFNAPSRWNMRIWDDDKKEWLCQSDDDVLVYYGFDITGGETTEFQGLPKWHPDRHLIWEQSTGLKDKNGKEIYDGDIVQFNNDYYKVFWDNTHACFRLGSSKALWWIDTQKQGDMEVVANLHENPELIGAEE